MSTNEQNKITNMVVYNIFIVSKSGGLIFNHDHAFVQSECEKTFSYPLDLVLKYVNKKITVHFGQKDGISVGNVLVAVNGNLVEDKQVEGRDVFAILEDESNFPITLKFARPKMSTNEKIFLASMFYPLFAIASQLSPEPRSSGIEVLEADTFKLHCFQTLTGVKFMAVVDTTQTGVDALLRRIYELYADFALKNPFYSLEMPIRCELFDSNLQLLLDQIEKSSTV